MASAAMLCFVLASGCTQWHPVPVGPERAVAATHPRRMRLTLTDSSVVVLKKPAAFGDSISGTVSGRRATIRSGQVVRTEVPGQPPGSPDLLSSWHTQRGAAHEVIAKKRPDRARLTLTDGSRVVLDYPMPVADSVAGFSSGVPTLLPSARIVRTEIRAESPWKVLAFVSAYAVVYFALCRGSPDCPDPQ